MSGVMVRPEDVVSFEDADRNTFNGSTICVSAADRCYLLLCVVFCVITCVVVVCGGTVPFFLGCLTVSMFLGGVGALSDWPRRVGCNRWGSVWGLRFSRTIYTPIPTADSTGRADLVIIRPREIGLSYQQIIDVINDSIGGVWAWERFAYYHAQVIKVRKRKKSVMRGERERLGQQEEWYARKRDYYRRPFGFPNQSNLQD